MKTVKKEKTDSRRMRGETLLADGLLQFETSIRRLRLTSDEKDCLSRAEERRGEERREKNLFSCILHLFIY